MRNLTKDLKDENQITSQVSYYTLFRGKSGKDTDYKFEKEY